MHHAAGDSGLGTASYIDDVILRDRDDNSGWTSAADGTLEERIYHCQNWRHDVVALVDGNGAQVEMARYSPYGVPFGLPAGDLDSDGDVDAADLTVFDALVAYDVRADLDLDGDNDATDRSTINANRGTSAGLGVLSQSGVASRRGMQAIEYSATQLYFGRFRVSSPRVGRHLSDSFAVRARYEYAMQVAPPGGQGFKLTFVHLGESKGICGVGECKGRYNVTTPHPAANQPVCGTDPAAVQESLIVIQRVTFRADCSSGAHWPSTVTFFERHIPLRKRSATTFRGPDDRFGQTNKCCGENGRWEAEGLARLFCDPNGTMTAGWPTGLVGLFSNWDCCAPYTVDTGSFPHHAVAPVGWNAPLAQATRYAFIRWQCENDPHCNTLTSDVICDKRRQPTRGIAP